MKVILLIVALLASTFSVDIPPCGDPTTPVLNFAYWNGTADLDNSTKAEICHD